MTTGKCPGLPISATSPVRHPGPPPERADAVIVGGGVIGVATALYLARKGLHPVVLEKGRVAAEQSARNWGWIRQTGRDLAEIPIMIEAQSLWTELAAEIGDGLGLRRCGLSYLADTEAELARTRTMAGRRARARRRQPLAGARRDRAAGSRRRAPLCRSVAYPVRHDGRALDGGAPDRRAGRGGGRSDRRELCGTQLSTSRRGAWPE